MSDLTLTPHTGPLETQDKEIMMEGMLSYHAKSGHPRKSEEFSLLLHDEHHVLKGCILVTFLWNGMSIETLWVDEAFRGHGWGTKLMTMAEEEAVKRGCTVVYTNTFPWQAPNFYLKLGYTQYGELEDFPKGYSLRYFMKRLG